jgi:sensor histidine kinase regulating citrate/malate metabolism
MKKVKKYNRNGLEKFANMQKIREGWVLTTSSGTLQAMNETAGNLL